MLLDAAVALTDAGCCVIPARTDGTKAPAVQWKAYQEHHPDHTQLTEWFDPDRGRYDGFGVVCGAVSGGLEMLELEGRAMHLVAPLAQLLADNGAGELWERLCAGFLERSPSGGLHLLYRVTGDANHNTKLARRPSTVEELEANPRDKIKVLIETRGEGGFVVVAPSGGRTHETGASWEMLRGGPSTIPTLTVDERDLLYLAASTFDEMPALAVEETKPQVKGQSDDEGLRPGDDYNQRADWSEILGPHGWQQTRKNFAGKGLAWTRPGKAHGVSATTGTAADGVDRLYVFSSSTIFDTERPYSKFAAYAHLEHGGDLSAAAAELRRTGYGAPLEQARPALTFSGLPAPSPQPGPGGTDQPPGPPPAVHVDDESVPDRYSLSDDGNALRLVDTHHNAVRYCPQRGMWLRWSGHRWTWDEAETIRELARGVSRNLPAHASTLARWKGKSLQNDRISAMVRLARTDSRVVVHLADLDAHPYQLNTPGGVVDLRTGQLSQPDPSQLHTRSTNTTPDPDQPAPRWERFLADTFAGDPDLTTYVQRLLGVSLIGEVLEQVLPFPYGAGANGKTTLLNAVQRIVGIGTTGYAISAPADVLLATRNNDHPATIAQFSGARLVVTSELDEGQRFAEAKVKQLTGSDPINARFMAKNPFTFIPTHTLWLLANHQPDVASGGPAFWRRIALLPFVHTVPPEQRDPHLEDILVRDEGAAILAWLIAGARDYLEHGLVVPESVRAATQAYELDQDTVTRFVNDICETGPHTDPLLRTPVKEVRSEYEAWCHYEGESPVSAKKFTQALRTQFGVYSERTNAMRWYAGIRITEVSPDLSPGTSQSATVVTATTQPEWWQR